MMVDKDKETLADWKTQPKTRCIRARPHPSSAVAVLASVSYYTRAQF